TIWCFRSGWGKLFNGNLLVNARRLVRTRHILWTVRDCVYKRARAGKHAVGSRAAGAIMPARMLVGILVQLEVIADASNTARAHHCLDSARGDAGVARGHRGSPGTRPRRCDR